MRMELDWKREYRALCGQALTYFFISNYRMRIFRIRPKRSEN